jgi:hypothetical protein
VNAYERASHGDQPSGQIRRSAEEFCHAGVEPRSSSRSSVDLVQRGAKLRVWAADLADHLAAAPNSSPRVWRTAPCEEIDNEGSRWLL